MKWLRHTLPIKHLWLVTSSIGGGCQETQAGALQYEESRLSFSGHLADWQPQLISVMSSLALHWLYSLSLSTIETVTVGLGNTRNQVYWAILLTQMIGIHCFEGFYMYSLSKSKEFKTIYISKCDWCDELGLSTTSDNVNKIESKCPGSDPNVRWPSTNWLRVLNVTRKCPTTATTSAGVEHSNSEQPGQGFTAQPSPRPRGILC